MEDTLREFNEKTKNNKQFVLILVLMEDTLRGYNKVMALFSKKVLILVLMEDTLRECIQLCRSQITLS